jgi:heterodisulfide reductase subunit B
MRYAFYPGCSLESSASEYKASTLLVARALGLEIEEIPDWICCGSTPAHMTDELLGTALPAHNLLLAKGMGADAVLAACASCYNRLKAANGAAGDPDRRPLLEEALGESYAGDMPVLHALEPMLEAMEKPEFASRLKRPLAGLRVASYYGCLLVRPPEVTGFDDPEDPRSLDRVVETVGAEPVDWRYKVECCGATLAFGQVDVVRKLAGDILEDAKESGADIVLAACPLCHSNLDLRQRAVERFLGVDLELPVLYFTQLVGLALGLSGRRLGLEKHSINPAGAFKRRGIEVR